MEKLILNNSDIKILVSKICREITLDDWRPDYVVGITRGGLLPAIMISHYFDIPMYTIKVSLRDGNDCESNGWLAEEAYGYIEALNVPRQQGEPTFDPNNRRNILIVDDINDSGATINWIVDDWKSGCFPHDPSWNDVWGDNVRYAAIIENTATKSCIKTSYIGMEINKSEKDVWVEFPYENWWEYAN